MNLRKKQSLFSRLLAEFLIWVYSHPGWETSLGEGFVNVTRLADSIDARRIMVRDRVHMIGSLHYEGLAQDVNLFVDGVWISDGSDPRWTELGVKWESMDPLCRWGGRFPEVDSNHFSLEHEGKA